ncbi:Aldehyde dehydrogenase family 2 member B4 [Diplonema papillatum]|nr:Aldehyde dehydrogenase family 2 member B4 [Diplonema papillatum]
MMKHTAVRLSTRIALDINLTETYKTAGLGSAALASALPKHIETGLFIGGEFVKSRSGKTFTTEDPATGKPICEVQEAHEEDVNDAVQAANDAFYGEWGATGGYHRSRLMNKLADLMERNAGELAALESLDNGKAVGDSAAADIPLAIAYFRYFAGWADKALTGLTTEVSGPGTGYTGRNHFNSYTRMEPVGPVGQIIPWNFPLLMLAWKLAPVLATGCTTVVKTAEQTPLSALKLAELIQEAGFPKGTVNILSGFGDKTQDGKLGPGVAMCRHKGLNKIAFTGSTSVGQAIMVEAAKSNLKQVTLELGGKSPNIVFADADLDLAIQGAHLGLFFNQGQCCCAGSRLFVEAKVYDQFVEKAINDAKSRVLGGAFTEGVHHGPQVSAEQLEKVNSMIAQGKKSGAELVCGGTQHSGDGYFVEPTIFSHVPTDSQIWNEEIFGPVMCIRKFDSIDQVVAEANDTEYGLAAAVWSTNTNKIHHMVSKLQAGTVWVNCYNTFDAAAPFGGFKMSGIGREGGPYALNNYLQVKQVTQALSKVF